MAGKEASFFDNRRKHSQKKNKTLRALATKIIDSWEKGENPTENPIFQEIINQINKGSEELNQWVFQECSDLLSKGKKIGLIGGEHSCPLGYYKALASKYEQFGILQIDAHCDLRNSFEGFTHSHASIMYNALKILQLKKVVQVGIRDCCQEEIDYITSAKGAVKTYFDEDIKQQQFEGRNFDAICKEIVDQLPEYVHISFDIDGLDPKLCPNTGTPVPGGLDWQEAIHLLRTLKNSGKKIIGFDVCEVAGNSDWDGNVGARIIYKLCNLL